MQFSIARLLLITLFVNFVLAATFALPSAISYLVLTLVSLLVIPPFIIVGVVNTRGLRQSFFLGAMVAGIPHFIISTYFATILPISLASGDYNDWLSMLSDGDEFGAVKYLHAIGYLVGAMGGGFGMAAFAFLRFGERTTDSTQSTIDSKIGTPPEQYLGPAEEDLELRSTEGFESFGSEKRLPPR